MVLCDSDDEYEAEAPLHNTVIQELVFSSHKNLDLQTLKLFIFHTLFLTEHTTNFLVLFHLSVGKECSISCNFYHTFYCTEIEIVFNVLISF